MIFFKRPIKLQSKIFYSISIILTVFIFAQFLVEYNQTYTKSLDYFNSTNQTINKILTENIRGYIYENDIKSIKYLVDAVENKYIKNIFILNADGKIIYSKNPTNKTKYNLNDLQLGNNNHISYSAFKLLDVNMGYMVVQANHEVYEKETKEQIVKLFVNLCLVYFLGLLLIWFISKGISQPLNNIIQNIQDAPSDKPIEFEEQHISEFQYLATTIKNDRNKLIDLNQTLEIKIKEEIAKNLLIEKKLFESEKLASMGEMIGNIAHQWRQPLSIISTIASGIKIRDMYGQMEGYSFHEDMDSIVFQTQYLSKTIDDFRNFIKDKSTASSFGIKGVIDKTISIVGAILKNHRIKIEYSSVENFTITGYENELIQCLVNLINNSKDAIQEKIEDDDKKFIFIEAKYIDIDKVGILTVYDSGGGIKEEIQNKIFEPYFTTKHQSVGTGIGLAMVYKILKEHHDATIEVSNYNFKHNNIDFVGARFDIKFLIK